MRLLSSLHSTYRRHAVLIVSALGYFVDVYDLVLFSTVRMSSLRSLGLPDNEVFSSGVFLLNMQMTGMLVGGILWGIWGDKRGRLSVLFGSIFLYSIANIGNAFVHSVEAYAAMRFIAGIGLAGELGAGITLVSETMSSAKRGYGTTIVATVGVGGGVVAGLVGDLSPWRISYIIGGILGLLLLLLRIAVQESGLYQAVAANEVRRGDLTLLFRDRHRLLRYLNSTIIGLPIWYVVGILITFSPEIATALHSTGIPSAGRALSYTYIGLVAGDLASGLLSQLWRSRKKALGLFIIMAGFFSLLLLTSEGITLFSFYLLCFPLGFAVGYWAVFVTTAAEQFGTNLRSTVTTTIPNFVRGAVVPMSWSFQQLRETVGILNSAMIVGAVVLVLSLLSLVSLEETYARDLDFIET